MNTHGGDILVEMLLQHGVSVVFGLAGGQTLPLYDGIRSRSDRIRHIPMRDERSAAYAADGYARISGKVGVCDATVGPGSIKFTSGLAEALNSSIPLVALISDMPSDWLNVRYRGGGNQLVDQLAVLSPLCKWTGRLPSVDKTEELVQRAFQMAISGRPGPVVIELPEDLFKTATDTKVSTKDPRFGAAPAYRSAPDPEAVKAAMMLLKSARRPVILAGGGIWISQANQKLKEFAERLAIPVATSLSGKGAIPEDHPLSLGVIGTLGGSSLAQKIVQEADLVFAAGFKFGQNPTFRWTLLRPDQQVIHLDIDGAEIGKIYPAQVGLVGDARTGLAALLEAADFEIPMDTVIERLSPYRAEWKAELHEKAEEAQPIKPQQVAALLNELAGPEDILVCDASFASGWGGQYFEIRDHRRAIFPRGMGGLGWGLPAAIGAQVARPGANVILLAGDGAMTYTLGELATLAQENLNVKVVVLNNGIMGWIKWEQAVFWDGKFQSTDLSPVDFVQVAEGLGCKGLHVSDPTELRETLAEALSQEAPCLVDARTAKAEAAIAKFTESARAREHMHDLVKTT